MEECKQVFQKSYMGYIRGANGVNERGGGPASSAGCRKAEGRRQKWRVGGQQGGEAKSGKPLNSFEDPSKYHRSTIEAPS
jgi:hypothetical protein